MGTKTVYKYWIASRVGGFILYFELGGWNVPEDEMETMQRLIDELMPNDKRRKNFRNYNDHKENNRCVFSVSWFESCFFYNLVNISAHLFFKITLQAIITVSFFRRISTVSSLHIIHPFFHIKYAF